MGAKRCDCQEVDLADPKACDTFAQKCDADVLINNAAMFAPTSAEGQGPMKGSPDDWDRMMVRLCSRCALDSTRPCFAACVLNRI